MPRYIDLSDKAKAAVQLRAVRQIDFAQCFANILAEAEKVKANQNLRETTRERFLEQLRRDWRNLQRKQEWARTGILPRE